MRPDGSTLASEQVITPVPAPFNRSRLLVVDRDGTLIKTDLLIESLVKLLQQAPLSLLALPFWLVRICRSRRREGLKLNGLAHSHL
jgi:hypothetical protein